jgi:pyruvate dehydrogenase E2 component (dihydrolipoamide acetyltransferase)
MAEELFIPKLGQTVEEVTLIHWLVQDGAKVKSGQEVMEVETDKAIFPVETYNSGYIHFGPYQEGDVLPVMTVVAVIGTQNESFEDYLKGKDRQAGAVQQSGPDLPSVPPEPLEFVQKTAGADAASRIFASPRARHAASEKNVDLGRITPTGWGGQRIALRDVIAYLEKSPKATPLASRMAAAEGIDLESVTGSGPSGKITREDVQQQLQQPKTGRLVETVPVPEVITRVPLKGVRAIIAERMSASLHTAAQVTLTTEVDMTEIVKIRKRLDPAVSEEWGFTPGYNDLLAIIVARSLEAYPYMNARLNLAEGMIEQLSTVNMGMAVDTERGLLVPVIHGANRMGLRQFGSNFRDLVGRARSGRSLPDDLTGGTFTITNLGMHEIDVFTPIINLPETAILGVGRIQEKPVVYKEKIKPRQMCTLSLVFDHRLVDGAPAARFLHHIKKVLENPYLLLA